ncbi:MAG: hypothetical protein ACRD2C_07385 [Acidimicrobiales bacterium]
MSRPDDREHEMTVAWLDGDTIEAIVAGEEVDPRFSHIAAFARRVRDLGDERPPAPSAALLAMFAESPGQVVTTRAEVHRPGPGRAVARIAALGLAAKIALVASATAAGAVSAGAAGLFGGQASGTVRGAIEKVTPIEFDDPSDRDGTGKPAGVDGPDDPEGDDVEAPVGPGEMDDRDDDDVDESHQPGEIDDDDEGGDSEDVEQDDAGEGEDEDGDESDGIGGQGDHDDQGEDEDD